MSEKTNVDWIKWHKATPINHGKCESYIRLAAAVVHLEAADTEIHEAKSLLAIIHRDGGEHTGKVGFEQSCQDAVKTIGKLKDRIDELEAVLRRAKTTFEPFPIVTDLRSIRTWCGGELSEEQKKNTKQMMKSYKKHEAESRQIYEDVSKVLEAKK